jgi:hypothetical protein
MHTETPDMPYAPDFLDAGLAVDVSRAKVSSAQDKNELKSSNLDASSTDDAVSLYIPLHGCTVFLLLRPALLIALPSALFGLFLYFAPVQC